MRTETNHSSAIPRADAGADAYDSRSSPVEPHTPRSPRELEREIDKTRQRIENTVHELERRLQPDALMQSFASPIRDNGAEFVNNLAARVRANPVPVLVAATGLAWLMAADGSSRRRPVVDSTMSGGYAGPDRPDDSLSADGIKRSLGETAAKASDEARGIAATVKGKIAQATGVVSSAMDAATGSARQFGAEATDTVTAARDHADELLGESRSFAGAATSGVSRLYREQPVTLGMAALALGAVAGALLPPTRREDQILGARRDQLLGGARDQAGELYDTAQAEVTRRAEDLVEQAKASLDSLTTATADTDNRAAGSTRR